MSQDYRLPYKDELGFCNIIFSAIGGEGANMAAKLLFKLGVEMFDLDGGYDAKYGSEKKGTPTDVSVRFCDYGTPVRSAGPTTMPHFLVAFREFLIRPLSLNRGLQANATAIVNTTKSPEEIRDILQLNSGTVITLDATDIAAKTGSRLNMPMLAMLCNELKFDPEKIKDKIGKTWPKVAKANIAAYELAVAQSKRASFKDDNKYPLVAFKEHRDERIGYLNMESGGSIDATKFSTISKNNRLSGTGFYPKFDAAVCITCGMCLTVCSDPGSLKWVEGKMTGIDEKYCKGCMRCVSTCPTTKKGKALQFPSSEAELATGGKGE
ncbi:MAG: 2-oxoacid:acceptor oxidoreductase family protein [Phycisphaerae bacterium]